MDPTNIPRKLVGSEDERAVSPVIGVILMVAITVILAAVIAAFVLDIGPGDSTLSATSDISEVDDDEIQVEIASGGGNIDGIAAVNSSGGVAAVKDGVSTGATVTLDVEDDGDDEFTIYGFTGTIDDGDTIDDADANVDMGSIEMRDD